MKTLVRSETNVSIWLFDDQTPVLIGATKTQIGDPVQFYIDHCGTSNVELHNDVTAPEDWVEQKYLYVNGTWQLNPDWVDPSEA